MKKITKITFYAAGLLAFTKAIKYVLNKNKKHINVVKEKNNNETCVYDKNKVFSKVKYIDITDIVLRDINNKKNNCK